MKLSLKADGEMPRRYVQQLSLQSRTSREVYRCVLNNFWRFALTHSAGKPPSLEVTQKWLINRTMAWSLPVVLRYASLVDRFLDWLVNTGACPANPLAESRKQYHQRSTRPIARALLSPDPAGALAMLRPLPRFGSFLGLVMRDHVALMKSMGYRYKTDEEGLLRFDRFLQHRPDLSDQPLKVLVREWSDAGSAASHALECQRVGRLLSKALRRIDPNIEPFPRDRRVERQASQSYRRPHIYAEHEVRHLLEIARDLPSPRSPLRPLTLYTMLVLAYCAGLRIGEIVRLSLGDIDFRDETIEIRDTKFFKSRRLPLAPSVMSALRHYLAARQQAGAPTEPASGLFWHPQPSGRYSRVMTHTLLVRILRRAGLKPTKGYTGPRIHDLRHAFVVNRMLAWYREGINPQSRLPYLATYLGHKNINSTLVYLTITQELLDQASERFRVSGAALLQGSRRGNA
jgi:integrase/recombinase XerD